MIRFGWYREVLLYQQPDSSEARFGHISWFGCLNRNNVKDYDDHECAANSSLTSFRAEDQGIRADRLEAIVVPF
jgi:hypothetical protein